MAGSVKSGAKCRKAIKFGIPGYELTPGDWALELRLLPGSYHYKLIVDGEQFENFPPKLNLELHTF